MKMLLITLLTAVKDSTSYLSNLLRSYTLTSKPTFGTQSGRKARPAISGTHALPTAAQLKMSSN